MIEQQLYVLRVWRDSHQAIHATLKGGNIQDAKHFANLSAVIKFIENQFEPSEPEPNRLSELEPIILPKAPSE